MLQLAFGTESQTNIIHVGTHVPSVLLQQILGAFNGFKFKSVRHT